MPSIHCTPAAATQDGIRLMDAMVDITSPQVVEIATAIGTEGKPVLWVNVNGVCVLRACRIEHLNFSSADSLLLQLEADLSRCAQSTHDHTPTRRAWPNGSEAMKVDQWWSAYYASVMASYRELANEAKITLAQLKALTGFKE